MDFNRLYFDSSVLIGARWPVGSNKLRHLLKLCKDLDIPVYYPEIVEAELDRYWHREIEKTTRQWNVIKEFCVKDEPDPKSIMRHYRVMADMASQQWGIIPLGLESGAASFTRVAGEFGDLLAEHCPEGSDLGFRDSLVLLSIVNNLQHFKGNPPQGLFLGRDRAFTSAAARKLIENRGVNLAVRKEIDEAIDAIHGVPVRSETIALLDALRSYLDTAEPDLIAFILGKTQGRYPTYKLNDRTFEVGRIRLSSIQNVRVFPDEDKEERLHRDPLPFSCDLSVFVFINPSIIVGPDSSTVVGPDLVAPGIAYLTMQVEIEGLVALLDNREVEVKFLSARVKSSDPGLSWEGL